MGSAESYARTDPEELGTDGNLPPPDVLTHDVFYGQHTYKLQPKGDCLLTPYVMCGSVEDPLNTNYTDHYIASALRTRADTERPRLNLMLVVDVSGSMNASMRSNCATKTKLSAVKRTIVGPGGIMESLQPGDRLGIVCFNTETKVVQELVEVERVLKDRVVAMFERQEAVGGTRLCHAVDVAARLMGHVLNKGVDKEGHPYPPSLVDSTDLVEVVVKSPLDELDAARTAGRTAENRILVITDEYLGSSQDHEATLRSVRNLSDKQNIHTTFVAVGTNYPQHVVRRIAAIKGCSSVPIHTAEDLQRTLVTEFSSTAVPVAYDVSVKIDDAASPLNIIEPLGASCESSKEVIRATTVFATQAAGDDAHCLIGLFRLRRPISAPGTIRYTTSYTDRFGVEHSEVTEVAATDCSRDAAFRKIVVLSRLATLLRVFLRDEHLGLSATEPSITENTGVIVLPEDLRCVDDVLDTPRSHVSGSADGRAYSDADGAAADEELFPDEAADEARTLSRRTSARSLGSVAVDTEPVHQSKISAHYRAILARFLTPYLEEEAAASSGDVKLSQWTAFVQSIVKFIPDEAIEAAAAAHVTDDVVCSGAAADAIFRELNAQQFDGKLREHHHRVVQRVLDKRLYAVLLRAVQAEAEAHPTWLLVSDSHLSTVRASVRKLFKSAATHKGWADWRAAWDPLLEATLRSVLHGRIFSVAAALYKHRAESGEVPPEPELFVHIVMQELQRTRTPDLATTGAAHKEVVSFVSRWIVPPILEHGGKCKWSCEQGVPVPEGQDEADAPGDSVAQCPTQ